MSKFKQILKELAGVALNIPDGELTELLEKTEDEINVESVSKVFKDKYRDNLSAYAKNQKDEGFKAAERSTGKKFEESLKKAFDITSDKQGDELISEIKASIKKPDAHGTGKELDDNEIKKSEVYLKMENSYKAQLKEAQEEGEKKLGELQKEYNQKETFERVKSEINKVFDSEGFFFDDDPVRAANKKEILIEKLKGYDYEFKNDQIIVSKDGKVVENEYGNKIDFKDIVSGLTSRFFAKKVTDKRQAPNSGKDDKEGKDKEGGALVIPKDAAELDIAMSNPKLSGEDKLKILDAYEKATA